MDFCFTRESETAVQCPISPRSADRVVKVRGDRGLSCASGGSWLIWGGEVAGVHSSCLVDRIGGFLGLVPVAQHYRVTARAQLASRPCWDDPPLVIDDLDVSR